VWFCFILEFDFGSGPHGLNQKKQQQTQKQKTQTQEHTTNKNIKNNNICTIEKNIEKTKKNKNTQQNHRF
jgi:hypothetical protein